MRTLFDCPTYRKQIETCAALPIDWEKLNNRTILISGASGMICSYLIDVLMYRNYKNGCNIKIIALGRNEEYARQRFGTYFGSPFFKFIKQNVNEKISFDIPCDYVIHGASNTHPVAYSTDPVGTITANIIGTQNLLEYAARQTNCRVAFLSTVEVYGENRGDTDKFDEKYCGYIDCNTLRAGYPESKRAGEALCQAYISSKNLDIVIPRLSRVYGPTMRSQDSKAIAQFIKKAVNKEDIVLKSEGNQLFSYTYAADAACALLYILLYGAKGEAYNIADENSDITLKKLARILAEIAGKSVIYELPGAIESKGYSKATKALLDTQKLKNLGWKSLYPIDEGLSQTCKILRFMQDYEKARTPVFTRSLV